MQTDDPRFIATEELLWLKSDGTEQRVVARIGTPYPEGEFTWACAAELEGADGRYPDFRGASAMQSLTLGLRFIATRLGHLLDEGEHLVYASDRTCRWNRESLRAVLGEGQLAPAPPEASST